MGDQRDVLGEAGTYPDQPVPEEGRPIVATVIGSVLVLLSAGVSTGPDATPPDPSLTAAYRLGEILGGAIAATLIVWGIAYAITIRHASQRWKIASFLIILLFASLASMARIGGRAVATQEDMAVVAGQIEQAARTGQIPDNVKAGDGPMGAMSAAYLNRVLAERRSYQSQQQATGAEKLLDFTTLTPDAPALRNCGSLAALAATARANAGRFEAHAAAARSAGDPFVARRALSEADRDDFLQGLRSTRGAYERSWALAADWAGEVGSLCRLLAARPWQREGGSVAFAADADVAAANRHLQRINALAAEAQRIERESRESTRQGLQSLGATSPSTND